VTIPNDGSQLIYPDGVATAIVGVDTAAIPGFVNRLQNKPADPALAAAHRAQPASVTLDVLNGTTISRLAGRNADALRAAGFHVDVVDSTDPTAETTIEYPNGGQSAAKAVAAQVPGAALDETSSVHKVTLVLGGNGVQARALGSGETPTSARPAALGQPDCIN
jgi:LytR cell envelope-related transcriptional attenuator